MRAHALALASLALAATGAQAGVLSVPMNHSVRLALAGPAQSVVVGSPSVVDVAVVDSRTVYVSGKAPGDTDVTVIDPLGRVVFRGDVTVAGGAAVSVFRGSARTEASCAPYCHDIAGDQALAGSAAAGAASGQGSALGGRPPTTIMGSPTVSSIPQTALMSR